MAETVKIGVDDGCRGLEAPDGRIFPVRDNVAHVPNDQAERFLRSNGAENLHRHRDVGIGWSRRSEQAWERVFGRKET